MYDRISSWAAISDTEGAYILKTTIEKYFSEVLTLAQVSWLQGPLDIDLTTLRHQFSSICVYTIRILAQQSTRAGTFHSGLPLST